MKKVLLILCLLLSIVGCSNKTNKEVEKLFDDGYAIRSSSSSENDISIVFANDEEYKFYNLKATLTDSQAKEFENLDIYDETKQNEVKKFFSSLDSTVIDLSDKVPTLDQLQELVGKPVSYLIEQGYENTGYSWMDYEGTFFYDNSQYELALGVKSDVLIDFEDLDENMFGDFIIQSASFANFGYSFFE